VQAIVSNPNAAMLIKNLDFNIRFGFIRNGIEVENTPQCHQSLSGQIVAGATTGSRVSAFIITVFAIVRIRADVIGIAYATDVHC
jgi:hypothetical protein